METKQIIFGIVTAAFVFGAYFIGLFQGQRHPIRWREFFRSMTVPGEGLLGSGATGVLGAALLRLHRARLVFTWPMAEVWRAPRRLAALCPPRGEQVFFWSACRFSLRRADRSPRLSFPAQMAACLHLRAVLRGSGGGKRCQS